MSIEKLSAEQEEARAGTGGEARSADVSTPADGLPRSRNAAQPRTARWLSVLALPLVFGLYVRAIGFATVYDDNVASPWNSLRDIPEFFTHDIFAFDGTAHSVYYRPIAMTWGLLIGLATGGTASWLHLSAILLHLAVMVLAYVFGCHLFGDDRLALLTAVLFGLHPSKVESVAWIGSSCVDGLGAVFFFAALIAFLKWRETESAGWLTASVVWFAGAIFTKETMVFIPMLLAVYLWLTTPRAGRIWRTSKTLLPYVAVWTVFMAIRHQVIRPASPSAEYIRPTFTLVNLWTAPYAIWWYIRHLVMPWGLSVEYAEKTLERPTLSGFVLPLAGLLLLLVAALWLWSRWRSKVAAFLMFWFVVTLAPAVIVAPMVLEHDRYLYIASYAFCALVAWMVLQLKNVPAKARLVAPLCVVVIWSGLTWHEMGYWYCDETLWARSLEISPSSLAAQMHMASIDHLSGNDSKALSILNDGLRYRPEQANLWLARSSILLADKQFEEARTGFLKVMEITGHVTGHFAEDGAAKRMRSIAAYQLVVLDFSTKNFVDAEHYARIALGLDYENPNYHRALSRSLLEQGRVEEADAEESIDQRLRSAK